MSAGCPSGWYIWDGPDFTWKEEMNSAMGLPDKRDMTGSGVLKGRPGDTSPATYKRVMRPSREGTWNPVLVCLLAQDLSPVLQGLVVTIIGLVHVSIPGPLVPISGPQTTGRWPWLISQASRADKQTRTVAYSSKARPKALEGEGNPTRSSLCKINSRTRWWYL